LVRRTRLPFGAQNITRLSQRLRRDGTAKPMERQFETLRDIA